MKCKVCGRPEEDHHEFVAQRVMPERCVCDARSWGDDVVPICRQYEAADDGRCKHCEHDKGCHK